MNTKYCTGCKNEKPTKEFYVNRSSRDGLTHYCKPCCSNKSQNWARRNPKRVAEIKLISKYGITLEMYDLILDAQGGGCAICKRTDNSGIRFCVDHDHSCCPGINTCGKCIRGLLCTYCNRTLATFAKDSPDGILNLLQYIGRRPLKALR